MKSWDFQNLQKQRKKELHEPFGYVKHIQVSEFQETSQQRSEKVSILERKASAFATSNANYILMVLLMLYLTGSGLNIFTIIITFQFIVQPIKAISSVNQAFKQFEHKKISLFKYKLIYLSIQGIILTIVLYKLKNMGLLPINAIDWVEMIPKHEQNIVSIDFSN